jgi:Tol biopolymer transport system component
VHNFNDVAVSPDGRFIATGIDGDLWTFEVRRRTLNRLTPGPGDAPSGVALFPMWSPDGRSVAYSVPGDTLNVVRHDGGEPSLLFANLGMRGGAAWSPDGRSMLVSTGDGDLRVVDLGSGRTSDFVASRFSEQAASFSPDGHWVAYTSDESGRSEVYVQRFPAGGNRSRISVEGGTEPAWSTGGSEIFFRSPRGFMSASISVGDQVAVRKVTRLFDDRGYQQSLRHREYAVLPGDTAFVFIRGADVDRLFLRVGWTGELDSLLPER